MLPKTTHTKLIVLIDPDKYNPVLVDIANSCNLHCIFVGGSKIKIGFFEKTILSIKAKTKIPIIIFPGDESQISKYADGILILSLLSGRNPDYLIGKHVSAANQIKKSKLVTIPTGYILLEGNKASSTQKITKTKPIKSNQEIIKTAIAGELLGKKIIYLEAGSGAKTTIKNSVIKSVKNQINIPLIVGGGLNSLQKIKTILKSNPDYIVVGNALESNPSFLIEINQLIKK
ncbi:MAG: geranylgeranylglyceryl/heptaprenylglyceryl phosphate synthase [Bacteroidota bacterium]